MVNLDPGYQVHLYRVENFRLALVFEFPSSIQTTVKPFVSALLEDSYLEPMANLSSSVSAFFDGLMQEHVEGPVVMSGDEVCIPRSADLLESLGLPGGLLPLKDIKECGFDKSTGLVWIKQKKKTQHYFKRAGRLVSFDEEVKAYVEDKKLKNVSGVKAKEYLVWAPVGDITVEGQFDETIRFKSYGGISRTFPANAFSRRE